MILVTTLSSVYLVGLPTPSHAEVVLARVQDEQITGADLALFDEDMIDGLKAGKTGLAADSLLLESMIDKKLMILEAKRGGIDKEYWFDPKIQKFHDLRVLKAYLVTNVNHRVVITEEELKEHFEATNRHRALRFAGILVKTLDEMDEILEELEDGADFAQLARERSKFEETAAQGGDIGRYLPKEATSDGLRDGIFHLQIGELSEPMKFPYRGEWHWVVIKILDEAPVPFWDVEQLVSGEVYERKVAERRRVLTDSLVTAYDPQLNLEFIGQMVRSIAHALYDTIPSGIPVGIDPEAAICTYDGGVMHLRDLQNLSTKGKRPTDFADSSAFVEYLSAEEIPFRLILEEARKAGLYERSDILQVVDFERQDQLISNLKKRAVDPRVTVTTEEARAFYDANPKSFLTYYSYEVVEILVAFEDLAKQIRAEIDDGADPEELASIHTIRKGVGHHGGRFKVEIKTEFRDLYRALEGHEEGAVVGPIRLPEGYSVFKMLYNSGRQVKPFDASEQRRARAFVKIEKMNRAYLDFIATLRERYPVEVYWQELEKLRGESG